MNHSPTRARPVGQTRPAMRSAIVAALTLPGLFDADRRVLLAVLELTAAHGKLSDRVCRAEIAKRAGVSERSVTRSLAKWERFGVIVWRPARAKGQFGELSLCCAPVDIPECSPLTRDTWMSRVQPQRETPEDPTRDTSAPNAGHLDVSLPPNNLHLPPRADSGHGYVSRSCWGIPRCEHGVAFDAHGHSPDGCVRNENDAFKESESRDLWERDFPVSVMFS
jgi:hypothetical protein